MPSKDLLMPLSRTISLPLVVPLKRKMGRALRFGGGRDLYFLNLFDATLRLSGFTGLRFKSGDERLLRFDFLLSFGNSFRASLVLGFSLEKNS